MSQKWEKFENQIEKNLEAITLPTARNNYSQDDSDVQSRGRPVSRPPVNRSPSRKRDFSPAGLRNRSNSLGRYDN